MELPLDEQNTWTFVSEKCPENVEAKESTLTFNLSTPIESMMITLNEGQLEAIWVNILFFSLLKVYVIILNQKTLIILKYIGCIRFRIIKVFMILL